MDTVTFNGVEYVRKDSVPATAPNGNRAVIVVDRGWIWAGDVHQENGVITLSRAVWVLRWEKIGFDGMIAHPEKAVLRKMSNLVQIPSDSEIFRIPVSDDWGLR